MKEYSFQELKDKYNAREGSYVHGLNGAERHELMFEPYHITPTEYRVLGFLYVNGNEAEPSVIADSLHVLRQTMTKIIDSLENRGFVMRKEHPSDRRRVYIALLPEGTLLAKQLLQLETAYADRVEQYFEPEELATYRKLFWKMQTARDEALRSFLDMRDHLDGLEQFKETNNK